MERMAPGLKRLLDLEVPSGSGPRPAPRRGSGEASAQDPRPESPAPAEARRRTAPSPGTPAPDDPAPPARPARPPGPFTPLRLRPEPRLAAPRRHRGPHPAGAIDAVRRLVETTTLPYRTIAARTGIPIATIARHAKAGAWLRPDTGFGADHYTPEGRRRLRRQALAERLLTLAERQVDHAARDPHAGARVLEKALRFVRAARGLDDVENR
jgi:hypothetical protein